ncbi:fibroblast growth factor intracellular binding protein [Capsaspora owczarzaki ATCC 30864]|uniref:Fibroblast growth factor intracellular binding protein n=1 Tax=Capsaspora owczarzaki (strain ATCC 30864) TaxID=595528 RepID=A0A0D2WR63_CAPO3|nr:fibroblast growth factor intracellular binding protein [Capsaspora owczarzaki ATCC 30864]KJE93598.1 fibroblast growth factor intracellular binding protein [Capsaspora owczarzaki ATCC 30864]|eukprot:XP_004348188.1 fibroblast growth factor intracellular binding protein [Capsaspora owczarzaki ATCC 30864]
MAAGGVVELDVLVSDPVLLNAGVFNLWLQGDTMDQALKSRYTLEISTQLTTAVIVSDTADQYQLFAILEHYLHNPRYLASQSIVPLAPSLQQTLLDRYYSFDDAVVRELLGKKLSARVRKDLDDVSEKADVSLQNCRRQFDNIKRISRAVEDADGGLEENIQANFLLSPETTRKYARIVFLCGNRFETNKKKLSPLTFSDFMQFAAVMMENWTVKGAPPGEDLDPNFLRDLRELRGVLTNDKDVLVEQRRFVQQDMIQGNATLSATVTETSSSLTALGGLSNRSLPGVGLGGSQSNLAPASVVASPWARMGVEERSALFERKMFPLFKTLLRNLFAIASGLSQSKELRDIFIDLLEKFVEPCREADWTVAELEAFLSSTMRSFDHLETVSRAVRSRYQLVYRRYLVVVSLCTTRMLKQVL